MAYKSLLYEHRKPDDLGGASPYKETWGGCIAVDLIFPCMSPAVFAAKS